MKTIRLVSLVMAGMAIILVSCSGDDGKDGLPGKDGINGTNGLNGNDGANGEDGISCWDLNGNGIGEADEDINNDGNFDALDCQGADGLNGTNGLNGADGQDSPNTDFYFQDGFKAYDGTVDSYIVDDGQASAKNGQTVIISYQGGNPGAERFGLMRFDQISTTISDQLVDPGQLCNESFHVNMAILYLYVEGHTTLGPDELYFQFGFYNDSDDVFDQNAANWASPDGLNLWSSGVGGESSNWAGPYQGTDEYSIAYGTVVANSTIRPGWVALPLPIGVVSTWICSENTNKGFRLRLNGNSSNSAGIEFISSDSDLKELRPVLVIQTEKIDLGAKSATSGNKTKDWENMGYEEQMAPLLKFLEMRNQ